MMKLTERYAQLRDRYIRPKTDRFMKWLNIFIAISLTISSAFIYKHGNPRDAIMLLFALAFYMVFTKINNIEKRIGGH